MTTTNEERKGRRGRRDNPLHPRLPSISSHDTVGETRATNHAVVDGHHTIAKYRDWGVRLRGVAATDRRETTTRQPARFLFVLFFLAPCLSLPASASDPGGRRRGCPLQSLGGLGKTSIISRCRRRWLTVASRCLDQIRSWRKLWAECRGRRDSEKPNGERKSVLHSQCVKFPRFKYEC